MQQIPDTRKLTVTLGGLAMIGAFAIDVFLPSFPAIATDFSVSPASVQLTLSAYLLAFAAMNLLYGALSDAFGRRPVIIGSLILFSAASVGAAFAPSFGWLLFFRVLQGMSAGGGRVVGQAVVRDMFSGPAAQRVMSHVTMVFALAPAIAPVLGGYLQSFLGWRSVFAVLTGLGLLLLFASYRFLGESLPLGSRSAIEPAALLRSYARVFRHPRFMTQSLAIGLAFGGVTMYISSAPHLIIEILRLEETDFAWLFIPLVGGLIGGSAASAKLARTAPPALTLRIGFACMFLAALGNVVYTSTTPATVPFAVMPVMLYAFGLGIALPVMTLMTLDLFPVIRGLAASITNAIQMLIFSMVSGLIAPLLFDSAAKIAGGVLSCFLLAAGLWAGGQACARRRNGPDAEIRDA